MNGLELFNALKLEAKELGINIQGMKKAEIEQAIRDAQAKFEDENPEVEPITEEITIANVVVAEVKRKGRPVSETSARQQRLSEQARLKEAGLLKRGRPSVEGSARQLRMEARAAKLAQGIILKPGRPKVKV